MTDTDPPASFNLPFSNPNQFQTLPDNKTILTATNNTADFADSFYGPNPPKMLCFGGYKMEEEAICSDITAATFKTLACQSESSSASSANNNSGSNPDRKRNGSGQNSVNVLVDVVNAASESKKVRSEKPASHAKPRTRPKPVRKENIGDRIAALQQLVSPFGKMDTASVLQETFSYIKFLHDQIQVLSSAYLNLSPNQDGEGLRSRGFCLVPVAYTADLASSNGGDYWAPVGIESNNNNG